MRIISGKYRGLKLAEFGGEEIRPTADRVKESLFSILSARVTGAKVLDLFCGSGNLGLECLSRGAARVHFNDLSRDSVAVLRKNLSRLKGEENYTVTALDFSVCLSRLSDKFDLVFIDPPYRTEYGAASLCQIAEGSLLSAEGVAVYERDRAFSGHITGLTLFDERKYGKTYLSFFRTEEKGI